MVYFSKVVILKSGLHTKIAGKSFRNHSFLSLTYWIRRSNQKWVEYCIKKSFQGLPWWSSDFALPMQGTWVRSLVKELDPTYRK